MANRPKRIKTALNIKCCCQLMVEMIPGLDMFPTWTACVAYVIWRRKRDRARSAQSTPIIDIESMPRAPESPKPGTLPPPVL